MPLETFGNIDDLDPANPIVDDPVSEGDDHLRGIKNALQQNVTGDALETRLLVAALVAAVIDATGFRVDAANSGPLIDLDNSLADEQTVMRLRNLIGGWAFGVNAATGRLQMDQLDADGVFENIVATWERDGKVGLRFDGAEVFQTRDAVLDNSGASVKDIGGVNQPVGFNVMPIVSVGGNLTLTAAHNGVKLRSDNNAHTITLPTGLATGMTVAYLNGSTSAVSADDTVSVPGTGRHYTGNGIVQRSGGTFAMAPGSVATFTHAGGGTWEMWGNGIS